MTTYSISANSITEGRNVFIRGKLAFARLTRLVEGPELAASDQRKLQNGMSPVGRPHTTATITEAEVVFADPAAPSIEEQFVSERCYASRKNPSSGANYSIDSKGTNLPAILIPSESGDGTFDQDLSGRELAQGVDVTLVLRTYKPKNYLNRGLALEQVIVHETPRYYNGGGVDSNELAARGIVLNAPVRAVQAPAAGSAVGGAPRETVGTDVEDGLAFPAPQPTAVAVQVQPATAPAVAAAPTPAPETQVAPVAAPARAETLEEKLARIEKENAELKNAGSAVGAPVIGESPWDDQGEQQGGITYRG